MCVYILIIATLLALGPISAALYVPIDQVKGAVFALSVLRETFVTRKRERLAIHLVTEADTVC